MHVRPIHKLLVLGVAMVCLIAGIAAVRHARASSSRPEAGAAAIATSAAEESSEVPYAAVIPAKRQPIANSLSIAGQFSPYQNVELHAKVAGYIQHINVDIGDHVHKGQVLAMLDVPEIVAQANEA